MSTDHIPAIKASFERAMAFLKAGDAGMAEDVCRGSLKDFPADGNLRCLLGAALNKQRKFEESEAELRAVVNQFPEFSKAHQELARSLMGQGRPKLAVDSLQQAVSLNPDSSAAHFRLGAALSRIGDEKAADAAMQRSFELRPDKKELVDAIEHQRAGRQKQAEIIYRGILTRDPNNVDALRLMAAVAKELSHARDAAVFLRRAVKIAPDFFAAWTDLAVVLLELEEFEEGLEVVKWAIWLEPKLAHPQMLLGNVFTKAGRYEDAATAFREGLEKQSDHGGCLAGLGHVLKTIGKQDEAIRTYRDCISTHPAFGEAYWSMANLKTFRFDDQEVATMEGHIDNENLTEETRINMIFSLGKAYEDREDYDRAFEHYERGSAMRRANEFYDPVQTESIHDRIIGQFTKELVAKSAGQGDPDPAPIFIVGLPRSGSTLIEQILASHSQAEGTHELPDLGRVIRTINQHAQGTRYPEAVEQLGAEQLKKLGRQYLKSTERHRTGKPFFTDKMPNNFPTIGLQKLILPNAKVINAVRHPLDSCMGSYKQLFFNSQSFTYDLVELGEYYLQYQRMIDHWHEVLRGHVLDVQYEDMVTDTEVQIRRLLKYCGLPWEDECLKFYETDRPVNTASSEQVRKPIYTTSIDSWRKFEKHLEPLIEVLEPLLMTLPEARRPESLKK